MLKGEDHHGSSPGSGPQGEGMNGMAILRYVILTLAAAAMVFGVLVMVGVLVPARGAFPDHYRIIIGAVIFLYGMYRFLISYFRRTRP